VSGDVSRANWVVPVRALTRSGSEGIVRLVACRDGSVTLHLSCAGTQGTVRLDISRAAQLSTGIWEAAGTSLQLSQFPSDGQPARALLPRLPTRSRKPAGNLGSTAPPGPPTSR
jgi:hypothetical protein